AATSWIVAHVLSLELPSTKISSSAGPIGGSRRTAASMFPASLRAGTTTDTEGGVDHAGVTGRATATCASASQFSTGSGASQRFTKSLSSGIQIGTSTRAWLVTSSNPDSVNRF